MADVFSITVFFLAQIEEMLATQDVHSKPKGLASVRSLEAVDQLLQLAGRLVRGELSFGPSIELILETLLLEERETMVT